MWKVQLSSFCLASLSSPAWVVWSRPRGPSAAKFSWTIERSCLWTSIYSACSRFSLYRVTSISLCQASEPNSSDIPSIADLGSKVCLLASVRNTNCRVLRLSALCRGGSRCKEGWSCSEPAGSCSAWSVGRLWLARSSSGNSYPADQSNLQLAGEQRCHPCNGTICTSVWGIACARQQSDWRSPVVWTWRPQLELLLLLWSGSLLRSKPEHSGGISRSNLQVSFCRCWVRIPISVQRLAPCSIEFGLVLLSWFSPIPISLLHAQPIL